MKPTKRRSFVSRLAQNRSCPELFELFRTSIRDVQESRGGQSHSVSFSNNLRHQMINCSSVTYPGLHGLLLRLTKKTVVFAPATSRPVSSRETYIRPGRTPVRPATRRQTCPTIRKSARPPAHPPAAAHVYALSSPASARANNSRQR